MAKIQIEFFHDVICSFCFPMSYQMRQVQKTMPELEIVHRSFALVKEPVEFNSMFGTRSQAKEEILHHWQNANTLDPLHRFNIEGMRQADFLFPTSMKALYACQAAFFVAGNGGYWDAFDALQYALFVQSRNIELDDVIAEAVKTTSLDFERWQSQYLDDSTKSAVEGDLLLAEKYNIHSVPCLIINGHRQISGVQTAERVLELLATYT